MTNEAIIRKARKKIRAAILEGDLTKALDELTIAVKAIKDNDKQALFEVADGSTKLFLELQRWRSI